MIFLAVLCMMLGFNILLKNRKNSLHILFFIQTVIIALYIICKFLLQYSDSIGQLIFFQKIAFFLLLIFFLFLFHFVIILTRTRVPKIIIILSYLVSFIISIFIISADKVLMNTRKVYGFWIFKDASNTLWFAAYTLFISIFYLVISYFLFRWIKKTSSKKEKKQGIIILSFSTISFLIEYVIDIVMPVFFTNFSPHLTPIIISFYIFGLYYAFVKYKFLNFEIKDLFYEVLTNISDMILILDTEGKIIEANSEARDTLQDRMDDLVNKEIYSILELKPLLKIDLQNLFSGKINYLRDIVNYRRKNETVNAFSYFSRITDKFGDFMGVLLIIKEYKEIKRFKEEYHLTDRQLEIIILGINGTSNSEICEKLKIKRRTVENHFFTIYNKLSIKNRYELIKLASAFNIK